MSTSGVFGFRVDGVDKLMYNHCDSYPTALGEQVCSFLRKWLKNESLLRQKVGTIELVDETKPPTATQISAYKAYADTNVSSGKLTEWYVLLRRIQGDVDAVLQAGVMLDGADYMQDSLDCEWAYVINLDSRELEIYRGFQKTKHNKGRYVAIENLIANDLHHQRKEYWPVALSARFSFDSLPEVLAYVLTENGTKKRSKISYDRDVK